jgi:hypothetical protein
VQYATGLHGISLRQALKTFNIRPSVYYYKPKVNDDTLVREQLSSLAQLHNRSRLLDDAPLSAKTELSVEP